MKPEVKVLTEASFADAVENEVGIVVVDFFKEDCKPCELAKPIMQSLAEEFQGKASFFVMDAVAYSNISQKFGVQYAPTVVVFKHGKAVDFLARAIRLPTLRRKIAAQL